MANLTGRYRLRTHGHFFGAQVLVLQVEERSGQHEPGDRNTLHWRDAKVEDVTLLEGMGWPLGIE
jgi:hypothetical protein